MFNTAIYDEMNERKRRNKEEHQPTAVVRYICRHIFTDGRRCGSVCLRDEQFCYYHHTSRRPAVPKERKRRNSAFNLPLIEDRASIQTSIAEVLRLVAANHLDPRRAGLILYGLQIASSNLPRHASSRNSQPETPAEQVEQVILDREIGPVAPPAIYQTEEEKSENSSIAKQLVDEMNELERINDQEYFRSEMEDAQRRIDEANFRAEVAENQIKALLQDFKSHIKQEAQAQGETQDREQTPEVVTESAIPEIHAVACNDAPPAMKFHPERAKRVSLNKAPLAIKCHPERAKRVEGSAVCPPAHPNSRPCHHAARSSFAQSTTPPAPRLR